MITRTSITNQFLQIPFSSLVVFSGDGVYARSFNIDLDRGQRHTSSRLDSTSPLSLPGTDPNMEHYSTVWRTPETCV